jgi:hypothetical protein
MRVLIWHVHGGYTDGFVRGRHEYLLPVNTPTLGGDGGLGGRYWPAAREVQGDSLRDEQIDVVVLQRLEEIDEVERLTGRRPGREIAAVYLEHNTPGLHPTGTVHPLADQRDIPIVHVTHFNRMYWDTGGAPTFVVRHGVPDPGPLYTGELPHIGVVINEPARRGRVVGADLLPAFGRVAPVDVFGMGASGLGPASGDGRRPVASAGDLPTATLHTELARRRVYLHPNRWTSLGLALLEAMHVGMPIVALAATEVPRAVPPQVGLVSNDLDELRRGVRELIHDPDLAADRGRRARDHALEHFGLAAFLDRWDAVLNDVTHSQGGRFASGPHREVRPLAYERSGASQ